MQTFVRAAYIISTNHTQKDKQSQNVGPLLQLYQIAIYNKLYAPYDHWVKKCHGQIRAYALI